MSIDFTNKMFQSERWITGVRIEKMDIQHRIHAARWLLRNAESIKFQFEVELLRMGSSSMGDMAAVDFDHMMDELMDLPARSFIRQTDLYNALLVDVSKAGLYLPVPSAPKRWPELPA
jgi:hypothetical protein